eukprot:COSAG02_NODE_288_length_25612_cov_29.808529_7_plen_151_part_00
MAPEQMLQENVGRKSDIWALGGVALLMATGQPPWAVCKVANPYACVRHRSVATCPPLQFGIRLRGMILDVCGDGSQALPQGVRIQLYATDGQRRFGPSALFPAYRLLHARARESTLRRTTQETQLRAARAVRKQKQVNSGSISSITNIQL